jgi:transposase
MFVRKKPNKGGSITVLLQHSERVAGKKYSSTKIVKIFGTARTKKEIAILEKQAREYKARMDANFPKFEMMKIASSQDVKACCSYNIGFDDVYGKAFDAIFSKSDFKNNVIQGLRDLAIMRIASPASKRKTALISRDYGISCDAYDIYKFMDRITPAVITEIKKTVYNNTEKLLSNYAEEIDVLFYDLTTIYFETSTQDEIRDFGFSKDGKHHHVQIMLAAIVTKDGLPIDYQEFTGNTYEGHTLIPVLNEIRKNYQIRRVVLVADAALMNKINLHELDEQGIKYIIAARIKNVKEDIKKAILSDEGYDVISEKVNSDGNVKNVIKAKTIDTGNGDFIIAYHSTKRARKDAYDREKDIEKIYKYLESSGKNKLTSRLKKPYIKVTKCSVTMDFEKLEEVKKYDGFFGLQTNITGADPIMFLSTYRGLWQIEQTFRITKTNLDIRPVFHYTPRRIRAHFAVCYTALALIRHIEFILKRNDLHTPSEQLHLMLDAMRKTRITNDKDKVFEFLEDPPPELVPIYKTLKITWPQKFKYRADL